MAVEAAMGEARALHDGVDADAVEASIAKQPRCRFDDAFAIFCRLPPADTHKKSSLSLAKIIYDDRHLKQYMTINVNAWRLL